jgi:ribose 5-phosphate isomerase A
MITNAKQLAAEYAVTYIQSGMTIGIGTGSTSEFAIDAIGKKVHEGLSIKAVASSVRSEGLAKKAGIKLVDFAEVDSIDLYIDGADEVDTDLNLVKGGGGALLREKIIAFNSKEFIVIVDDTKLVHQLGKFHLPVEVVPFAVVLTMQQLRKLGCTTAIRRTNGNPFVTDNRNFIIDCDFKQIAKPEELQHVINEIPGVVEHGLFPNSMVNKVVVGYEDGEVQIIKHN